MFLCVPPDIMHWEGWYITCVSTPAQNAHTDSNHGETSDTHKWGPVYKITGLYPSQTSKPWKTKKEGCLILD